MRDGRCQYETHWHNVICRGPQFREWYCIDTRKYYWRHLKTLLYLLLEFINLVFHPWSTDHLTLEHFLKFYNTAWLPHDISSVYLVVFAGHKLCVHVQPTLNKEKVWGVLSKYLSQYRWQNWRTPVICFLIFKFYILSCWHCGKWAQYSEYKQQCSEIHWKPLSRLSNILGNFTSLLCIQIDGGL